MKKWRWQRFCILLSCCILFGLVVFLVQSLPNTATEVNAEQQSKHIMEAVISLEGVEPIHVIVDSYDRFGDGWVIIKTEAETYRTNEKNVLLIEYDPKIFEEDVAPDTEYEPLFGCLDLMESNKESAPIFGCLALME